MSTIRACWFRTSFFWADYPHTHLSASMKATTSARSRTGCGGVVRGLDVVTRLHCLAWHSRATLLPPTLFPCPLSRLPVLSSQCLIVPTLPIPALAIRALPVPSLNVLTLGLEKRRSDFWGGFFSVRAIGEFHLFEEGRRRAESGVRAPEIVGGADDTGTIAGGDAGFGCEWCCEWQEQRAEEWSGSRSEGRGAGGSSGGSLEGRVWVQFVGRGAESGGEGVRARERCSVFGIRARCSDAFGGRFSCSERAPCSAFGQGVFGYLPLFDSGTGVRVFACSNAGAVFRYIPARPLRQHHVLTHLRPIRPDGGLPARCAGTRFCSGGARGSGGRAVFRSRRGVRDVERCSGPFDVRANSGGVFVLIGAAVDSTWACVAKSLLVLGALVRSPAKEVVCRHTSSQSRL
ncbi:hypothetical protein B0H17DRAFT_1238706 [Mycena rosella]|uniref:Uncharacterized protein n=1 Tax=Mycena rosella TaxID=1033263 RepID=A0AAD7AWK7_MYCRO|nr:hypothetical protein B0H17DRAFT_1238706 [Mycena rosella]